MDELLRAIWTGGKDPGSFPHICPYRLQGAGKAECIELSGTNYHHNRNGCCGTSRASTLFAPCNSSARRCIVCLEIGRRGIAAHAVADTAAGTCEEHAPGKARAAELRIPHRTAIVPLLAKTPVVIAPEPERVPEFEARRRGSHEKLAALEAAAIELKRHASQITVGGLMIAAARMLRMTPNGLRTFYSKSVPVDTKTRLLYGENRRKVTRSEIKFGILMRVREQMRKDGDPAPTKKELAIAAAKPLGMTLFSTQTYIYDRLKASEVAALGLKGRFMTRNEQVTVLRRLRQEMKDSGLPVPRQSDLAEAAAPLLRQKVDSVRSLIVTLSPEIKRELEFIGCRSRMLVGLDAATIREGFVGAIAVLKLRRAAVTAPNLRKVLRLKSAVVESYLSEHSDIAALLDR